MNAADLGIDLGTSSILVYVRGKGVVLKEPSVVAFDKDTNRIKAIGDSKQQDLNSASLARKTSVFPGKLCFVGGQSAGRFCCNQVRYALDFYPVLIIPHFFIIFIPLYKISKIFSILLLTALWLIWTFLAILCCVMPSM